MVNKKLCILLFTVFFLILLLGIIQVNSVLSSGLKNRMRVTTEYSLKPLSLKIETKKFVVDISGNALRKVQTYAFEDIQNAKLNIDTHVNEIKEGFVNAMNLCSMYISDFIKSGEEKIQSISRAL